MKNIVLYLMLLIAVPATAQSGLFGSHSHHSQAAGKHYHGSLMQHGPLDRPHATKGMNPKDFEAALLIISKESFDSNRLDIAKQIVKDNGMSTKQIAQVCSLFTFDSNKLEFAKFAYHFCVDRKRYFLLDEVFTYNSSKEELHEYIRQAQMQ